MVKHICESYAWCLSFTPCPFKQVQKKKRKKEKILQIWCLLFRMPVSSLLILSFLLMRLQLKIMFCKELRAARKKKSPADYTKAAVLGIFGEKRTHLSLFMSLYKPEDQIQLWWVKHWKIGSYTEAYMGLCVSFQTNVKGRS